MGKREWAKRNGKMQRSVRQPFSPCLLRHSKKCSFLGVNDPVWEIGFEPFPHIPYGFLTRCP